MLYKQERPVETRPIDLYYVQVPGEYSSEEEYEVVPASDIKPENLANNSLNLTILNFFAGDLPGEDDWDAQLWSMLAKAVPRFRQKADETKRYNEAFLKLRVAYWKERRSEKNKMILDDGPYFADQAFQFVVEDYSRAGGFSDRRIFESIRIREALVLHIELQELDEFEKDVAPYADVLKGTGLDAALQLSPQFSAIIPIASGIVRNIARLNKSDIIWDQEFTITTTSSAIGQSKLREGIYVAMEASPEQPIGTAGKTTADFFFDPQQLKFKNHRLLYPGKDGKLKLWPRGYLVFTIHQTPQEVANPYWVVLEKYREELSDEFLTEVTKVAKGPYDTYGPYET